VPGFDAQKIIVNGSGMQGTTSGTYNKY
jgi:hypothetical protein